MYFDYAYSFILINKMSFTYQKIRANGIYKHLYVHLVYAACKRHGPFSVVNMSKEGNLMEHESLIFEDALVLGKKLYSYFYEVDDMQDLSSGWLHCDPGPLFKPQHFTLPGWVSQWVSCGIQLNLLLCKLEAYIFTRAVSKS